MSPKHGGRFRRALRSSSNRVRIVVLVLPRERLRRRGDVPRPHRTVLRPGKQHVSARRQTRHRLFVSPKFGEEIVRASPHPNDAVVPARGDAIARERDDGENLVPRVRVPRRDDVRGDVLRRSHVPQRDASVEASGGDEPIFRTATLQRRDARRRVSMPVASVSNRRG